jgi:tetratricopeptide (TPR) repeat protein
MEITVMANEQFHELGVHETSAFEVARWEQIAQDAASREALTEAVDALRHAAELEPHNIERWLQIARWQRQNGDPVAAQSTLETAIKANDAANTSKVLSLWLALAELQLQAQNWDDCIASCQAVLAVQPREHFALEMLATALLHKGELDASMQIVQQLLRLSPRDPLHRMRFATLLQVQGHAGEALREWEIIAAMYPDAPFSEEAEEAIDMLDRAQIHQVLLRAADERTFGWELQRDIETTLDENNYYLSDGGMETLRQLIWDGRLEESSGSNSPRLH